MSIVRVELEAALSARYLIESELGAGAAATVYLAYDVKLDRQVALKVLRPELAAVLGGERFLNEIRVTSQLSHPNIIPLFDSGDVDGYLYYTMPVVDGESLREKLDREKQLSVDEAVSIACAIAQGLAHAHDHGIVHRDIKPENILLHRGVPLIADFGIAAAIDRVDADRLTATGISLGTPKYMSPEMVTRDRNVGPSSDIYALATVLYEMLAGDTPFTGSNVHAIISRIVVEKPTKLRVIRATVPAYVEDAVNRALAKVPADRFVTARDFADTLKAQLERPGMSVHVSAPRYFAQLFAEIQRRRVIRVVVAYLAAAVIVLGAAEVISNALQLPRGFMLVVVLLLLLGFVVAVAMSWIFSWTDGSMRLEIPVIMLPPFYSAPGIVGVALLIGGVAAVVWVGFNKERVPLFGLGVALDSTHYAVLPGQLAPRGAADENEDERLRDALAAWSGIEVRPMYQVHELAGLRGAGLLGQRDDRRLARKLGAGRYVRPEVRVVGGRRHMSVMLHDTRTGNVLADTSVALDAGDSAVFRKVAAALLMRGAGIRKVSPELAEGTLVFPAAVAFLRGHENLLIWDVEQAGRDFDAALAAHPDFSRAALWSAQTLNWSGVSARETRPRSLIERAATRSEQLLPYEQALAEGLHRLSSSDFAAACSTYQKIITADSTDFAGWYGMGECYARDFRVIADNTSPSGWRYRSSLHQGVIAYRRALVLLASTRQAFNSRTVERLREVLFTSTNKRRAGRSASSLVDDFSGMPGWNSDTLTVTPYSRADVAAGRVRVVSTTQTIAVDRHRTVLRDVVSAWSGAFPPNAHVLEAVALVQEITGHPDAVTTLRRARSAAATTEHRQRLSAREAVLIVKLALPDDSASLQRAALLIDSILESYRVDGTLTPGVLSVAAALRGRISDAAALNRAKVDDSGMNIRVALSAASEALTAFAALGAPFDSIASYQAQIEAMIRTGMPLDEQDDARYLYFAMPVSLGYPRGALLDTHKRLGHSKYWIQRTQRLVAEGDTAAARAILQKISGEQRRALLRVSDMPADGFYLHSWLNAAVGDTTAAVMMLDSALHHVRWIEPGGLSELYQAAGLMWSMVLRAELAAAQGDTATARRWATPVRTLWGRSDVDLDFVLQRSAIPRSARR